MHPRFRRAGRAVAALTVAIAPAIVLTGPTADAQTSGSIGGFAHGTVAHAHALQGDPGSGATRAVDAEVGFSSAAADSGGLGTARTNEVRRVIQPAQTGKAAYATGSGVEVGLGLAPPESDNQVLRAGHAEATSPPAVGPVVDELGSAPPELEPLAWAALLRAEAQASAPADLCLAGTDLARGYGQVADAQLLDQDQAGGDGEGLEQPVVAVDAPNPSRAVAHSTSRMRLVPQTTQDGTVEGDRLGIMAETRMTIAPVTIDLGGNEFTIEVLGEWVLRAVATGKSGWIHYGPGDVNPSTPILRVIDQAAGEVLGELTTQTFFDNEGLVIPIADGGTVLAEVAIGEDPRAIGGDADSSPTASATRSAAAVDVVRVKVLHVPDTVEVADIRVGHMEVSAHAPAGGISCGIAITKTANPETVSPGDGFVYDITVTNPHQCTLSNLAVDDLSFATEGITFTFTGASDGGAVSPTDPPAEAGSDSAWQAKWSNLGSVPPNGSKAVSIDVSVDDATQDGVITDRATARATCGIADASGTKEIAVPVEVEVEVEKPEVKDVIVSPTTVAKTPVTVEGENTAKTGAGTLVLQTGALGLLGLGSLGGLLARHRGFGRPT